MNETNQKPHNNSYESGISSFSSSSSSTNLSDPLTCVFSAKPMDSKNLADFITNPHDVELYNTSVEEGIFPNVSNDCHIEVPSYVQEFNYNDTTPLVYSWFPVVPGFYNDGYNNLHNFSHINGKLDVSDQSDCLEEKCDENKKSDTIKMDENIYLKIETVNCHELENSCNAMDLNLTTRDEEVSVVSCDLSFNGKIDKLKEIFKDENKVPAVDQNDDDDENDEQLSEEEKIRNESFEMLKKEDSSLMLMINEKSPEVAKESDTESSGKESPAVEDEVEMVDKIVIQEPEPEPEKLQKFSPKSRDIKILEHMRSAINRKVPPPPSIINCSTSLSEMLSMYNENVKKSSENFVKIKTNSLFIPSHSSVVRDELGWPQISLVNCLDVTYNQNRFMEIIESERLKFSETFVGAETSSSFNFRISNQSAKKKIEKLKLANPSPNSRLKKLTFRRSQFSLDSLKTMQSTSQPFKLQIDSKLLQSKRRMSAKKKTPGKRKTPGSAKRRASLAQPRTTLTRSSSKRALFTSPAYSTFEPSTSTARDLPNRFPRKNLFSFDDVKKRKRSPSPSHDNENRSEKFRRVNSPAKLLKSQSFSVAPQPVSNSLENLRRRDIYHRTQSEVNLAPRNEWKPIRYEKTWDGDLMKKKLLFTVSSILAQKGKDRTDADFNNLTVTLVSLVKKVFKEFYNPRVRSDSDQLSKFANLMVAKVIQKVEAREILRQTRDFLNKRNPKSSSTMSINENRPLSISQSFASFPVLNNSTSFENSINSSTISLNLNRSSSKNNNETNALRENFQLNRSTEKSAKKLRASESNLVRHNSMPNPGILKAKRQISF